ncbi:unnamed protein product [Rotaria magnacalcarata]|uniref:Uncharacterized protein n=1 Tax=Rotaria magnacalcarata TaxID=392030 RepID=A0A819BPZ8_9BILA|nr:unnamed protein product [Rotaria magnacalcarata]
MISNQFTKVKNNTQKYFTNSTISSVNRNTKSNVNNNISASINSDDNSQSSTPISWNLFSSIKNQQDKTLLNKHNSMLKKQNLSDCIDWANNHQLNISSIEATTINNQLNAINFLQENLVNGNGNVLIDLLHEIAHEINIDQNKNQYSYSAINNNYHRLTPMFNSNLQLSNNKEKKNKKEKSSNKEKKSSDENKEKQGHDNEIKNKNEKKHKQREVEDTKTTDSDTITDSPVLVTPRRLNFNNPKSPSYSPAETFEFQTFSVPVPQSVAQLSQVQHQLQSNPQNSFENKTTQLHNISVQQQLQSLSQMAHDGDEILITLTVNALSQKQHMNNNNQYQSTIQNNKPYSPSQSYHQIPSSSTGIIMPRNLEIVAKGFARVQNEHPQPPPSNIYLQPPIINQYSQSPQKLVPPPPFAAPHYSMPYHTNHGPPQIPIGPPIQPLSVPPNMMMSGGFVRPTNYTDATPNIRNNTVYNRSHTNNGKCNYLCQSSVNQPDFRGRPLPGLTINPYFSNSSQAQPMNFSSKQPSKHRTEHQSNQIHTRNSESMNRTYSSIY